MERSAQAESDRLSYSLSAWDYCIHSISESSLAPVFSIVILITTFCDKQQKLWIKYVKRYYSLDTFQNRGILLECLKKKKENSTNDWCILPAWQAYYNQFIQLQGNGDKRDRHINKWYTKWLLVSSCENASTFFSSELVIFTQKLECTPDWKPAEGTRKHGGKKKNRGESEEN